MRRYKILLEKKASKRLQRLTEDTRMRMIEALRTLGDEGFSRRLDIRKLRGYRNHYRLRIGKHRVLFELRPERTIVVYAVLPRRAAY